MLNINEFNAAFLAANPQIAKKMRKEFKRLHPDVIVMALKPKYAKAIYEGRKQWEFRKAPPPLMKEIFIYESAPVSAITGTVYFCEAVRSVPSVVWDTIKRSPWTKNNTGISLDDLKRYAGKDMVTALRVYDPKRIPAPVKMSCKPPQNWGKFQATFKDKEGAAQ